VRHGGTLKLFSWKTYGHNYVENNAHIEIKIYIGHFTPLRSLCVIKGFKEQVHTLKWSLKINRETLNEECNVKSKKIRLKIWAL
jgi:hypothetical protein